MIEVELKYPVPDWERLRGRLQQHGAQSRGVHQEVDDYFNAPDRDFAATGEALRIRTIDEAACLTYKGPKRATVAKTRQEIEVPLLPGLTSLELGRSFLLALGYRPVATVRKTREVYTLEQAGHAVNICLDTVEGLGGFVELEVLADDTTLAGAEQVILNLAREWELPPPEPRSYLRMWLEHQAQAAP